MKKHIIVYAAFLLPCLNVSAQRSAPLTVGSPAPEFKVAEWIKGDPVEVGKGKVQVIEFTIVGCGPCIKAIPHLTAMNKKYAGKINLVSVFADGKNVPPVKRLVKNYSSDVSYPVAVDTPDEYMKTKWMAASGNSGYPKAFVVDKDGMIAWIGNPNAHDFDAIVENVYNGTFDMFAKKEQEAKDRIAFSLAVKKYMEPAERTGGEKEMRTAIAFLDSLIEPDASHLHSKFNLLLKHNEQAAYAVARKALEERVVNGYWISDFLYSTHRLKNPDWGVFRDISAYLFNTENKAQAGAYNLMHIAEFYYMEGRYDSAIAAQERVIAHLQEYNPDKPEWMNSNRRALQFYHHLQQREAASVSDLSHSCVDSFAHNFKDSYLESCTYPTIAAYNQRKYVKKGYRTLRSMPLEFLYRLAYLDETVPFYKEPVQIVYEVDDYKKASMLFAERSRMFNYSLQVPETLSDTNTIRQVVQRDLALAFGYSGRVVEAEVPVYRLIISDKARQMLKPADPNSEAEFSATENLIRLRNNTLYLLRTSLGKLNPAEFYRYPIINESVYGANVDLDVKLVYRNGAMDIPALQEALKEQGIELVKGTKRMKVLIISDKSSGVHGLH